MLKGNAVSPGVALAPAFVYIPETLMPRNERIAPAQAADEIALLQAGMRLADGELVGLIDSFPQSEAEQAKIFAAHREILHDEAWMEDILGAIREDSLSAETAVFSASERFLALLSGVEDETLSMRIADLMDVRNRLIRCLRGKKPSGLSALPGECILVARDLLPSDTVSLDRKRVLGIVTENGGATSHTAILARSYGIPALLGVPEATRLIRSGDELLLDACEGTLSIRPNDAERMEGISKRDLWLTQTAGEDAIRKTTGATKDGTRIQIGLNIGSDSDDIPDYVDFVGLFRTEFLYMNGDRLPTEEEQLNAYRRVLKKANGRPVTLRTLDIGADKALPYWSMPKEENPALGKRALRLCLEEVAVFKDQLRAALRASVFGDLWLMLPMVGTLEDIDRAKAVIREVKEDLRSENVAFREDVKLGIMIEIPSIALIADLAAKEVDFASIGTNDLCQYTHAADRMNAGVAAYYVNKSTSMYRLIDLAIRGFRDAGKPISVCGELGGDPDAAEIMVGMGIRKLSMNHAGLAAVKRRIADTTLSEAEAEAQKALKG